MKKIFGFMIMIMCCCFCDKQVFAQETKELQLFNYENENMSDDVEKIQKLILCVYGDKYNKLDICEYVSFYNNDDDEVIYIYPIYSLGKCVLLGLSDGNGNVNLSEDTSMYEKIVYSDCKGECIPFFENGTLYFRDNNETKRMYKTYEDSREDEKFQYAESIFTVGKFKESLYNVGEKNIVKSVDLDNDEKYTSVITSSNKFGSISLAMKKCNIKNFVSQGNDGLCWAASVATIVNYKRGLDVFGYTARNVADIMEIGYNEGGTIYDARDALAKFGFSYSILKTKMSWYSIKRNISLDKPFMIGLKSDYGKHFITGYGYTCDVADAKNYTRAVCAWDSNGYQVTFFYNADKILISGIPFTWIRSIY
ncbi:MAG: hypothetical protein IJD58_06770 [Lachnospiraceae bacterium]|nr:hypothetical protein [Lachnospiraceae bacterium]